MKCFDFFIIYFFKRPSGKILIQSIGNLFFYYFLHHLLHALHKFKWGLKDYTLDTINNKRRNVVNWILIHFIHESLHVFNLGYDLKQSESLFTRTSDSGAFTRFGS